MNHPPGLATATADAQQFGGAQAAVVHSRYRSDFQELHPLGRGGFGVVVAAINRYAALSYAHDAPGRLAPCMYQLCHCQHWWLAYDFDHSSEQSRLVQSEQITNFSGCHTRQLQAWMMQAWMTCSEVQLLTYMLSLMQARWP